MSPLQEREEDLISADALQDFLTLILQNNESIDLTVCSSENGGYIELLGKPASLRSLLSLIDPCVNLPSHGELENSAEFSGDIENLKLLLSDVDKSLECKYTSVINHLQTDLDASLEVDLKIPLNLLRRIGEILLLFSVESSRTDEIIEQIMTELSEKTQLEFQSTIQKLTVSTECDEEATSGSGNNLKKKFLYQVFSGSLGYEVERTRPPETKSESDSIEDSLEDLHQSKHEGTRKLEESSLWKQKYDALKTVSEYSFLIVVSYHLYLVLLINRSLQTANQLGKN